MRSRTSDERMMIACCNDGTRPVTFKIERFDYLAVKIAGMICGNCAQKIRGAFGGRGQSGVSDGKSME